MISPGIDITLVAKAVLSNLFLTSNFSASAIITPSFQLFHTIFPWITSFLKKRNSYLHFAECWSISTLAESEKTKPQLQECCWLDCLRAESFCVAKLLASCFPAFTHLTMGVSQEGGNTSFRLDSSLGIFLQVEKNEEAVERQKHSLKPRQEYHLAVVVSISSNRPAWKDATQSYKPCREPSQGLIFTPPN